LLTYQCVLFTVAISVLLGVFWLFFGGSLLCVMGASEEVLQESLRFFTVVGGGAIFMGCLLYTSDAADEV
ncbi:hypothetical protein KQJ29_39385, partial [Enterococcus sp. S181_ASV_20]|nr:hypothetical protein [Enterococcus sp. S181_ASV_20]